MDGEPCVFISVSFPNSKSAMTDFGETSGVEGTTLDILIHTADHCKHGVFVPSYNMRACSSCHILAEAFATLFTSEANFFTRSNKEDSF